MGEHPKILGVSVHYILEILKIKDQITFLLRLTVLSFTFALQQIT